MSKIIRTIETHRNAVHVHQSSASAIHAFGHVVLLHGSVQREIMTCVVDRTVTKAHVGTCPHEPFRVSPFTTLVHGVLRLTR